MTIEEVKTKIIQRATDQIKNSYGNLTDDQKSLLGYFFDDAVLEINKWRKLTDNTEICKELYNTQIIRYIIRTYQEQGIEGQSSSSVGGDLKSYRTTPLQEMLCEIKQRI